MKLIRSIPALRREIHALQKKGGTIGFIPTMGALHEGHLSLIHHARRETDCVVVSIFVNPTQFNQKKDLIGYPRRLRSDSVLCQKAGTDILFVPDARSVYPENFQTEVTVRQLSRRWEGQFRPGHFQGVATVVTKLFNLVEPTVAYFGQKDAQQARIIQQLAEDLNFDIRVKVLPTVREKSGLAMSSRNKRLSEKQKTGALVLVNALREAGRLVQLNEVRSSVILARVNRLIRSAGQVRSEYSAIVDPDTLEPVSRVRTTALVLLAAWAGNVRLIDCGFIHPKRKK